MISWLEVYAGALGGGTAVCKSWHRLVSHVPRNACPSSAVNFPVSSFIWLDVSLVHPVKLDHKNE